jgi:hypothetical protein
MVNKPKKLKNATTVMSGVIDLTTNKNSLANFLDANFPKPRKKKFTSEEKKKLRPIAETLAMLDGNAFFGVSIDDEGDDIWYEGYLPDAWTIWKANGGDDGWASEVSWIKDANHENEAVKDAYQHWQLLKILSKKKQ